MRTCPCRFLLPWLGYGRGLFLLKRVKSTLSNILFPHLVYGTSCVTSCQCCQEFLENSFIHSFFFLVRFKLFERVGATDHGRADGSGMGEGGRARARGHRRASPLQDSGDSDSLTRSQFTTLTYIFPTVRCEPSEAAVCPFPSCVKMGMAFCSRPT